MSGSQHNYNTRVEGSGDAPVALDFLAPAHGPDEIGWLAHYRVLAPARAWAVWASCSSPKTPSSNVPSH